MLSIEKQVLNFCKIQIVWFNHIVQKTWLLLFIKPEETPPVWIEDDMGYKLSPF